MIGNTIHIFFHRLSGCSRKSDVSGVEESIVGGGDTSSSNPSSLNGINSKNKEDSLTVVSEKGKSTHYSISEMRPMYNRI